MTHPTRDELRAYRDLPTRRRAEVKKHLYGPRGMGDGCYACLDFVGRSISARTSWRDRKTREAARRPSRVRRRGKRINAKPR